MSGNKSKLEHAEALWLEFGPTIHRTLLSYEADPQLREDLAQNVFLALLSACARIDSIANIRAYVLRIVHNVATTHIAKEVRRKWIGFEQDIVDTGPGPGDRLNQQGQSSSLMTAIRKLKLPYRQVMVLLLEDFDDQEIADIVGISYGNVRVRINRAKAQLKALLETGEKET